MKNNITRQQFLKLLNRGLAATGLAVVVAPIVAYFYPPSLEETPSEPVSAGSFDDLPENASLTVRYGRYPALVIHTPAGLRAYSAVCTHFACICKWDAEKKLIICPCHDGFFDPLDGTVISGPPPTPLTQFSVNVVDGEIFIGGEV